MRNHTTKNQAVALDQDATTPEIGAQMRRELREAFPGVKFSVVGSRGTGYGWIEVRWTDGPTDRSVRAITDPYKPLTHCEGVNTSRCHSDAAEAWAEDQVRQHPGRWPGELSDGTPNDYFQTRRCLAETSWA